MRTIISTISVKSNFIIPLSTFSLCYCSYEISGCSLVTSKNFCQTCSELWWAESLKVMDHKKLSVCVTASCTWLRILLTKLRQWNCCLKPFIVLIMKTWYINYTGRTVPTSRSMMLSVVRLTFALTTKPCISYRKLLRKCDKMMISEAKYTSTHLRTSYHWSQSTCDSIYATSCKQTTYAWRMSQTKDKNNGIYEVICSSTSVNCSILWKI